MGQKCHTGFWSPITELINASELISEAGRSQVSGQRRGEERADSFVTADSHRIASVGGWFWDSFLPARWAAEDVSSCAESKQGADWVTRSLWAYGGSLQTWGSIGNEESREYIRPKPMELKYAAIKDLKLPVEEASLQPWRARKTFNFVLNSGF